MINTDSYSLFVFTTQRRFSSSLTPIYFGGLALVSWPEGGELLTCRICRLLRRRKASDTLQQKLIRRSNCVWMPPAPFRRQSPPPEMWNVAVSELMGGSLADGTSTQVVTGERRVMFRSCLNCDLNYTHVMFVSLKDQKFVVKLKSKVSVKPQKKLWSCVDETPFYVSMKPHKNVTLETNGGKRCSDFRLHSNASKRLFQMRAP